MMSSSGAPQTVVMLGSHGLTNDCAAPYQIHFDLGGEEAGRSEPTTSACAREKTFGADSALKLASYNLTTVFFVRHQNS